jgi:hypothetical protein
MSETVADFIARRDEVNGNEAQFNKLALEMFDFQYRFIEPYRRLCQRRGKTPETVETWSDIPAVPADAFKHFSLFAGKSEDVVNTFRSSGTTAQGLNSQSHFSNVGLELMKTAIEVNAARMLFPDGRTTKILALAPDPDNAPAMIMAYGMRHMIALFGIEGSRFCIGAKGLDVGSVLSELRLCQYHGVPVTLMGSSFGFVHLLDSLEGMGVRLNLPQGSRLMDAGGYKGRSREIDRNDFVQWACSMLGLPKERVVNLLGMTEMASQIYDGVLADHFQKGASSNKDADPPARAKQSPPWVRTRVLDPTNLIHGEFKKITDANRPGLLRHLDLANVERPMMIQSDDIGFLPEGLSGKSAKPAGIRFEITGRVKSAEPRGCSLSLEELASIAPSTARRSD